MFFRIVSVIPFLCTLVLVTLSKVECLNKTVPTIKLGDGYEIPAIGLGTSKAKGKECERAVKDAIDVGYRHIDTAFAYGNENEIGNAVRAKIEEGVIRREDIFITSKLWNTFHDPTDVLRAFQKSFDDLNLGYIDLYLMHSPMAYIMTDKNGTMTPPKNLNDVVFFPYFENGTLAAADVDYLDTWRAMELLVESGKVRSIGVSNFNSQQIDRLLSVAKIRPVINQVECHVTFNQHKMLKFCAERGITVTAFAPLGQPYKESDGTLLAINDPKIAEIAVVHNKSAAQVVLRYTYQNGAILIPKTTNKEHMRSNIDIFDFELSDAEIEIIDGLNTNTRRAPYNNLYHKDYPFNIEF